MEANIPDIYHYTNGDALQMILRDGMIRENRYGVVYLSPTKYTDSKRAVEELAIANKLINTGIRLSTQVVPNAPPPERVEPFVDDTGHILPGGGWQVIIQGPITLPIATLELT